MDISAFSEFPLEAGLLPVQHLRLSDGCTTLPQAFAYLLTRRTKVTENTKWKEIAVSRGFLKFVVVIGVQSMPEVVRSRIA